jgi:hypothetical protein
MLASSDDETGLGQLIALHQAEGGRISLVLPHRGADADVARARWRIWTALRKQGLIEELGYEDHIAASVLSYGITPEGRRRAIDGLMALENVNAKTG